MDRRQLLKGSALLAHGLHVTSASAQAPSPEKKTYVLVPGAFWGAWVWRKVEPKLQSAGHRVFCGDKHRTRGAVAPAIP